MAMNLGPGTAADADEPIMDINTTPLIDVMLVLLVMLIITIPVQLHAVNLQLPQASRQAPERKPEVVRIDIDATNGLSWNGEALVQRADLEARLQQAAGQQPQPQIHLRAHPRSKYKAFAEVMVSANRVGLNQIAVINPPAAP
jgi:biopolymer transport protein ExbD